MNELQITISQQLGVITTNFDDVKGALLDQMDIYKELDVTESNKPERKKDISSLRKMVKAVNDKRIEVKKECLKPYEVFEKQANELVDIINEPIKLLDNQVKEFEDKQRAEKIKLINDAFNDLVGDLIDYISIEKIYDSKWENVATSLKSIKDEMSARLDLIRSAVMAIKAMQSDKTEEALNRYYDNLDLASAISFINRYEQQKKEIEQRMIEQQNKEREAALERERERIRREEREAIAKEEIIRAEAEAKVKKDQEEKERAEREAMSAKETSGTSEMVTYKIIATPEEFEMIEMYLNSIGAEFLKGDF
jgi:hypothetical protein